MPGQQSFVSRSAPEHAKRQLQLILALFLLALTFPIYLLFSRVYRQLENETLYQYAGQAESVVRTINARLEAILEPEDSRSFDEYSFFNLGNIPLQTGQGLTYSPLAQYPPRTSVPGVIGYFQVNPDGSLQSPMIPKLESGVAPGLDQEELANRIAAWDRLTKILANDQEHVSPPFDFEKKLDASPEPAASPVSQAASAPKSSSHVAVLSEKEMSEIVVDSRQSNQVFPEKLLSDESTLKSKTRVSDLNLDTKYLERAPSQKPQPADMLKKQSSVFEGGARARRKEKVAIPVSAEPAPPIPAASKPFASVGAGFNGRRNEGTAVSETAASAATAPKTPPGIRVMTLEGEVDPFQFRILDDLHVLFLRKVWRGGVRYLQGFVVQAGPFFKDIVEDPFLRTQLAPTSTLIVGYRGVFFRRLGAAIGGSGKEIILYRTFLDAPFDRLEILITTPDLPVGPGAQVVNALAYALVAVLLGGLYGIYRLGLRQILFAKERSDFVSAVSHELKTPLTSIRMYSEMLRSGWVNDEEKRKSYYDFIFTESERLSRLIANVLQFATLSNTDAGIELKRVNAVELLDQAVEKVRTQVEQAGFRLERELPENFGGDEAVFVDVDSDAFSRIAINLVDNALKFSAKADDPRIVLGFRADGAEVIFSVRDFGPGVARDEMKKIFQLFYRVEDEMHRSTPGTGIGLALVKELASKMNATVDLKNHTPGAEFTVRFARA